MGELYYSFRLIALHSFCQTVKVERFRGQYSGAIFWVF